MMMMIMIYYREKRVLLISSWTCMLRQYSTHKPRVVNFLCAHSAIYNAKTTD